MSRHTDDVSSLGKVCSGDCNLVGAVLIAVYQGSSDGVDFQVIDVEYPEYKNKLMSTYGTVLLGCGWVVGTTILKEVEILERTSLASIQSVKTAKRDDDVIYNLTGQKVDTSYKGIVIQNGKKVVK